MDREWEGMVVVVLYAPILSGCVCHATQQPLTHTHTHVCTMHLFYVSHPEGSGETQLATRGLPR